MTSNNTTNSSNSANALVLQETRDLQSKTRESLFRTLQQAAESEELGHYTLAELQSQREQQLQGSIQGHTDKLHHGLSKSKQLQDRFDRWAGNFSWKSGGSNKSRGGGRGSTKKQREDASSLSDTTTASNTSCATTSTAAISANSRRRSSATSKQAPRSQRDDVLLSLTNKHTNTSAADTNNQQRTPQSFMTDEDKAALAEIEEADAKDIDGMLDSANAALDRLSDLACAIQTETSMHGEQLEKVDVSLDRAHGKQEAINRRLKRVLGISSSSK